MRVFWAYAFLLTGLFAPLLFQLFRYALGTEVHSHVVLIPAVAGWLLWTERRSRRGAVGSDAVPAGVLGMLGVAGLFAMVGRVRWFPGLSENDLLSIATASYLCLLTAGGFAFLGRGWLKRAAFPVFFLVFMIPLPDRVMEGMENAMMMASADVSGWLFRLSGTSVFRVGQDFHLPGFSLAVAQECSGIRSSWVLFITSLLASHLFLRSNWRRTLLVAVVIPLGILRNGLRIVVIGLLCVHKGPHMIDSWIHHKGGSLFFALSLIPLFGVLWWLRRGDGRGEESERPPQDGRATDGAGAETG